MYRLQNDRHPRNPKLKRFEIRIYNNWPNLRRALTQLRRRGIYAVDFLEVHGPAILLMEDR